MAASPVLFPLWPRPRAVETLEWLTFVQISEDGTGEERVEMRDVPRQGFRYEYFVPPAWQPRINNILYGGRPLQWQVPVWPQVQHVGAIAAGQGTLQCETRYSEFRAGSSVLLWESPTKYQVMPLVSVVDADTLDVSGVTTAFTDAWLMPLRLGHLSQNPQRRFDGRQSIVQLAFDIDDNAELTPAAPVQYEGEDLHTEPGLLDGGELTEQLVARIDKFDEQLGLVTYASPWENMRPARIHRMMGETPAENWAVREFLHRRAGRSRAFWLPSFEADFRVVDSGPITGALTVAPDDYQDFAPERVHVAIETPDGWLAREITATNLLSATQLQLVFDASLGGVDAASIRRVSLLGKKRLDADRVEINYMGAQVASCAVPTVELQP